VGVEVASASGEVGTPSLFFEWVNLIVRNERYYLAEAMGIFYRLPSPHQKGLLSFFVEKIPNRRWEELFEDPTRYMDVIRSILYYYTGHKKAEQPTKEDFGKMLGEYCKSDWYKNADREIADPPIDTEKFRDLLE